MLICTGIDNVHPAMNGCLAGQSSIIEMTSTGAVRVSVVNSLRHIGSSGSMFEDEADEKGGGLDQYLFVSWVGMNSHGLNSGALHKR